MRADEMARMSRQQVVRLLPAAGPGLLMLALGLIGAGRPVLSWDEIATADVARRTPAQIWHLVQHVDGVFGPYYFLAHFWTSLAGSSPVSLRLPSIVAMAGAAAVVGALGRRCFGPATGALAGVLFCLLPGTTRYAAEARPYAFACFFALLALFLLERALDRPVPGRWVFYGLAVVFVGLSHLIALTTLAAHAVVMWRRGSRRTVIRWAASAGPAFLALGPLFWFGAHQRGAQLSWVPPLTTGVLWKFPGDVVGSVAAGWLLLGFAVIGLCRPVPHRATLAALILGPVVTVGLVSWLVAPYWVPRYLLVVLAPLALLAAAGLHDVLFVAPRPAVVRLPVTRPAEAPTPVLVGAPARSAPPARAAQPSVAAAPPPARQRGLVARTGVVLALIACAVYPAQRAVRSPHAKAGSDYRTAAAIVGHDQQPGDGIIYTPNSRTMRPGLASYLPHGPADLLLARTAASAGELHAIELPPTAARLGHTPRLWLLLYGHHQNPLTVRTDLRTLFEGHFRLDRIWFPRNATLALYVRDDR
jgi:mannosyltransferase